MGPWGSGPPRPPRYLHPWYVLLKGLKRAVWPNHKCLCNTYKNSETLRQRPRHLLHTKNHAAPRHKSNKVLGFILKFAVPGTIALVNSRRFAARLSVIEFSPRSGIYSGPRAPSQHPFFRENRTVLPVKCLCIKWLRYQLIIIQQNIAALPRVSFEVFKILNQISITDRRREFNKSHCSWNSGFEFNPSTYFIGFAPRSGATLVEVARSLLHRFDVFFRCF